jgi:hypothetical protein
MFIQYRFPQEKSLNKPKKRGATVRKNDEKCLSMSAARLIFCLILSEKVGLRSDCVCRFLGGDDVCLVACLVGLVLCLRKNSFLSDFV